MSRSAGRRAVKNLMGLVVALVVVLMLALLVRVVFEFFGALHATRVYGQLIHWTGYVILPAKVKGFRTPYGGTFDVVAVLSIVLLVVLEYVLTAVRKRV